MLIVIPKKQVFNIITLSILKHNIYTSTVMQEGLANVCLVTSAMTITRAKIERKIPKKDMVRNPFFHDFHFHRFTFFIFARLTCPEFFTPSYNICLLTVACNRVIVENVHTSIYHSICMEIRSG